LDGLRIVHLSDLHIVKSGNREARATESIRSIEPDLILLTGDYIEDDGITPGNQAWAECADQALVFLSRLHATHGVYAVRGNWDPSEMIPLLSRAGIRVLDNQTVVLEIRGGHLRLCGIPAVGRGADECLAELKPGIPTIVLHHFPEAADDLSVKRVPVDLVLAGHWHGGQVSWPFFGPYDMPGMKYPAGLFRVGRIQLYVNRGLGMHSHAVRLNCPSEVTLIVLRRE
jgi:hypothetical protein